MISKKGNAGNQIMIVPYLFIIVIISMGIASGMWIFFGSPPDFRPVDSTILSYNIQRCILENEVNSEFTGNFFKNCWISQNVTEKYYDIKICLNKDSVGCIEDNSPLFISGSNFQICGISGIEGNANYPVCVKKTIIKGDKKYSILVLGDQKPRRIT
jgi:hypothetical protein